jgi:hypothetical protein
MQRNEMNPRHWRDFLAVLDTVERGREVSSNHLRDLLAAADIPEKSRGGLFAQAASQGYLKRVRYEPSTGDTANRSVICIYKRTRQQGPVAA